MQLVPKHPPGRSNRKARAYATDIARLRTAGYTLEAIRSALADIGVPVSLSTVQREAARAARQVPVAAECRSVPAPAQRAPPPTPSVGAPPSFATDQRTGKEIAAEFFANRISNPLVRDRSSQS